MRVLIRRSLLVGLTFCLLVTPHASQAALSGAGKPQVTFSANGPMGMKIAGQTTELKLVDDGTTLSVIVVLAHLETGIGLRDSHMREKYLEVPKYPKAQLSISRSLLRMPGQGADIDAEAKGELLLHGVKKSVMFRYHAALGAHGLRVSGKLHLDIRDFGIEVPRYLGVSVKPEVEVAAEFEAKND
jgi:polyisoprenoid-binding protein YceI